MYFVPEKGRFYRWAVHTKPLHRYLLTFAIFLLIGAIWFFGINPWLVGLMQYEQAQVQRAGQQKVDACVAERLLAQHVDKQKKLSQEIEVLLHGQSEPQQLGFIFDTMQKTNLSLNSFAHEKEKQKEWRTKRYKSLSLTGTLDHCMQFLSALASSPHMIQCKQLTLQKGEQEHCALQCQLEFIACG